MLMSIGAENPGGGFFSPTIPTPLRELSVLPCKDVTVLAGDTGGEENPAFFGGRPKRDGPGPTDCLKLGLGVARYYSA